MVNWPNNTKSDDNIVGKWNWKEIWKGKLKVGIVQMQFGTNQKLLEVIQRHAY